MKNVSWSAGIYRFWEQRTNCDRATGWRKIWIVHKIRLEEIWMHRTFDFAQCLVGIEQAPNLPCSQSISEFSEFFVERTLMFRWWVRSGPGIVLTSPSHQPIICFHRWLKTLLQPTLTTFRAFMNQWQVCLPFWETWIWTVESKRVLQLTVTTCFRQNVLRNH